MIKKTLKALGVVILLVCVGTVGYMLFIYYAFSTMFEAHIPRSVNDFEIIDRSDSWKYRVRFFQGVAGAFQTPELCHKISSHAYINLSSGLEYIQESCLTTAKAMTEKNIPGDVIIPSDQLREILMEMGYSTIPENGPTSYLDEIIYGNNQEVRTDFIERVKNLPDAD